MRWCQSLVSARTTVLRLALCGSLVGLSGCPWISAADHAKNLRQLGVEPKTTDTAVGTGHTGVITTPETGATGDTRLVPTGDTAEALCVDDTHEENDTLAQAKALSLPASLSGVLCPEDTPTQDHAVDYYAVDLTGAEVMTVTVGAGATTSCADHELLLEVFDPTGKLRYDWDRAEGACATVTLGYGAGGYRILVSGEAGAPVQDYQLSVTAEECFDDDNDGVLAQECGGPDCQDSDVSVHPGAQEIAQDGVDQDCDGHDGLSTAICDPSPDRPPPTVTEDLPCGDLESEPVWDKWRVDVKRDDCVEVRLDNDAAGADLLAYLADKTGANAGLSVAEPRVANDEWACSKIPWTEQLFSSGFGCPQVQVTTPLAGRLEVWVAQVPDEVYCPEGAGYGLTVTVNGEEVTPDLVIDDGPLVR